MAEFAQQGETESNDLLLSEAAIERLAETAAARSGMVFREQNWHWSEGRGQCSKVPSEARIALVIHRLIRAARAMDAGGPASSGRFTVTRWLEDGAEGCQVDLEVGSAITDG